MIDEQNDSLNYLDQIVQKGKSTLHVGSHEVGRVAWNDLKLAERIVPNRLHCPAYNGIGS